MNWLTTNPNFFEYGPSYVGLLPKVSVLLVEFIALLIIFVVITLYKRWSARIIVFLLVIIALIMYSMLAVVFNDAGLINVAVGIRNYLAFFPLFIAGAYLSRNGATIKPYLKLMLALMIIQVPVALGQYLIAIQFQDVIRVGGTLYDVVSGTMGGIAGNLLAVLMVSAISLIIPFLFSSGKKVFYLMIILSFLIVMALSEAKGGILLFIIICVFFVIITNVDLKKKLAFVATSLVFIICFIFIYSNFVDQERQAWNPVYLIQYEQNKEKRIGGRLSRFDALSYSLETVSTNPISLVFGFGIGNATRNSFPYGEDGKYYDFNTDINYWNRLLLETGLLGVLINILVFMYIYRIALYLKSNSHNFFLRRISEGILGCVIIYIFAGLYDDTPMRFQYIYPFSLLIGYLHHEYIKIKKMVI